MIDYSKWPRRYMSVTSIKLDEKNPRLPETSDGKPLSQPKIIHHLVENEGAYELAKKIATQGYFPNEEPIVFKENKKMVVLEGNRRVCACKILLNPDLLAGSAKRKRIKDLLKDFDLDVVKKLYVRVAPNRESADVILVNRHTEGSEIEKWDKTRQDRFFFLRFKDGESLELLSEKFGVSVPSLKDGLKRHNVYAEMKELDLEKDVRKGLENESKFSMTNVERFYNSKEGKDFLQIEFDEKGNIKHKLPKEEFNKRLNKIVEDAVNKKIDSRNLGDSGKRQKYLDDLKKSEEFNFNIKPSDKFESEYSNDHKAKVDTTVQTITKKKSLKKPAAQNKLMSNQVNWQTGYPRIDEIFKEIKKANLDKQFNSAAILFRSYLDMIVYQYLLKNNEIQEILKNEQQKLDSDNTTRYDRIKNYFISIGTKDSKIDDKELKKAINSRTGISKDWVPSLKQMLSHLSKSSTLLPDNKLRQALASYLKGKDGYLGHNEFNLFVHNEYYIKNSTELKTAFNQMEPVLEYLVEKIQKNGK